MRLLFPVSSALLLTVALCGAAFSGAGTASPAPTPDSSPRADWKAHFGTPLPVNTPIFALTFDDGPLPQAAPDLLGALAKAGMHATFCVQGNHALEHPELLRLMLTQNHELASHTFSHPKMAALSDDELRDQLKRTDAAIFAATGTHPHFFRPPNGVISQHQVELIEKEFGYQILLWSLDSRDYTKPPAGHISQTILGGAKPGVVILAHESFPNSVQEMPAIIAQLGAKGLKSVTVSELVAASKKS